MVGKKTVLGFLILIVIITFTKNVLAAPHGGLLYFLFNQQQSKTQTREIKSLNFQLRYPINLKKEAEEVLPILESELTKCRADFDCPPDKNERKVPVVLFNDSSSYIEAGGDPNTGFCFDPKTKELFITLNYEIATSGVCAQF